MINPSIQGWVDKFLTEQKESKVYKNEVDFYNKTRETGFIFGHITSLDISISYDLKEWLPSEISKIGLLSSLYNMYLLVKSNSNSEDFKEKITDFYNFLKPKGFNPLHLIIDSSSTSYKIEKIIEERIQTNENLFSKNFSHVLTNALLFIDVLAFEKFLKNKSFEIKYLNKIEDLVISIISFSLQTKTGISEHDELLLKLFESSVRYNKSFNSTITSIEEIDISVLTSDLERFYLIDLAGISLWSDEKVENEERYFLFKLGEKLNVSEQFILESIHFVNTFISKYKTEIPYFNNSNPVKNFYDQTTESVVLLINRNKNRFIKELSESKELMQLIAKSTHKELDKTEKKKIKNQLLDICKTVPSLTIFLLPGGSLLLPILIKFIPKLLPSSFNENIEN